MLREAQQFLNSRKPEVKAQRAARKLAEDPIMRDPRLKSYVERTLNALPATPVAFGAFFDKLEIRRPYRAYVSRALVKTGRMRRMMYDNVRYVVDVSNTKNYPTSTASTLTLELLEQHPEGLTVAQLGKLMGIERHSAKNRIHKLMKKELVSRVDDKPSNQEATYKPNAWSPFDGRRPE